MNILVTGGAGYIGSHCCKALAACGHLPIVFDSLVKGRRENVRWGEFVHGDIGDPEALEGCLKRHRIDAVMHFAAFIEVGESVADPLAYYANNVGGTLQLLRAVHRHGVRDFVFSSSAAVYGTPERVPIEEDHSLNPLSPYGWTKRMMEAMLEDFGRAYGLRWAALRYFNAAGADRSADIGEAHDPESHLIPRMFDAAIAGRPIEVFGGDYPTADGTCIRDYVHVSDLAAAHVMALERLAEGGPSGPVNLGQGRGYSVMEVVRAAEEVTGMPIAVRLAERRPGDAPVLVASNRKAREVLGWTPRESGLDHILRTAWAWHRKLRGIDAGDRLAPRPQTMARRP
ncbi:MAG: UDP-glucose 4-epimerase GalE [Desulfobacterales bacterium]|jgi:UDP-glucose-4-epimerase GalE|nr:UDP-glucose 4-epimerase GalE [Desulfobacterales bacterium]